MSWKHSDDEWGIDIIFFFSSVQQDIGSYVQFNDMMQVKWANTKMVPDPVVNDPYVWIIIFWIMLFTGMKKGMFT